MNHRQLSYFLEVYKHCSISNAAEQLFISPQALSKTILSLENEIGLQLFHREGRRIVPTKAAMNLISHAENILNEFSLIESKKFLYSSPAKTLKLLIAYDSAQYFSADFYQSFISSYPEILLSAIELPDSEILHKLDENKAQLAIVPGPINEEKYNMHYLFSDQFSLLINKNNPLAQKKEIFLSDMNNIPLIIKERSPLSTEQLNLFASQDAVPNVILEMTDYHVMRSMVEKDYAVGMILNYIADQEKLNNIVIRPFVSDHLVKSLYLIHNQGITLSNEALYFKEFCLNWMHNQ